MSSSPRDGVGGGAAADAAEALLARFPADLTSSTSASAASARAWLSDAMTRAELGTTHAFCSHPDMPVAILTSAWRCGPPPPPPREEGDGERTTREVGTVDDDDDHWTRVERTLRTCAACARAYRAVVDAWYEEDDALSEEEEEDASGVPRADVAALLRERDDRRLVAQAVAAASSTSGRPSSFAVATAIEALTHPGMLAARDVADAVGAMLVEAAARHEGAAEEDDDDDHCPGRSLLAAFAAEGVAASAVGAFELMAHPGFRV